MLVISQKQELLADTDVTVFTVDRLSISNEHGVKEHSGNILNYVNKTLGTTVEQVMVGDNTLHPNLQVWSGMAEASLQVDCLILSDNKIPDLPEFIDDPWCPPRNTLDPKDYDSDLPNVDSYRPWIEYTKDQTVKIAIDLGLNEIFKIGHTCSINMDKRCGTCWYCRERAWAFAQNNYIDPGKL